MVHNYTAKTQKLRATTAFLALAIPVCASAETGVIHPQPADLADRADAVADAASRARATLALQPDRKIVVTGERPMTSMVLAAAEIEFSPGSRLVISDSDQSSGNFFIVADKIIIDDPEKPGVITWGRTSLSAPPDRGQAQSGGNGSGEGASGGAGAGGEGGVTGTQGQRAPSLTIFVKTIVRGGLIVDMRGNQGGPGGNGQQGGNGGAGAQGSGARQARKALPFGGTVWLPYCESGPGFGGKGGAGGRGGIGGTGGIGGAGGSVTLVSLPENLPTLFEVIRVNTGGGDGGKGGPAGAGGHGGAGGPEGHQANFCNSAGRNGPLGADGAAGSDGQNGPIGPAGQPFVANLAGTQFSSLFGF